MKWDKIEYPFCLPEGYNGNILRMANFHHFIGYFGFDLMSYGGYPIGSYERLLFGEKRIIILQTFIMENMVKIFQIETIARYSRLKERKELYL